MAQNIVARFPVVPRTELSYGETCGICREPYSTDDAAVRLPCNHEFGSECISTWLSPEGGKNTCPLCRCQLFPSAPGVEETHAIRDEDWDEVFISMCMEIDSSLRAIGIGYRSRGFRDWLLYMRLQDQGAVNLPRWRPDITNLRPRLESSQEEALFRELQRIGAFRLLPITVGPSVSERQIWDLLRDNGYSYGPIHAATVSGCAWVLS